jgi:pimeloyl-ACP methyl ester carboxylesterase
LRSSCRARGSERVGNGMMSDGPALVLLPGMDGTTALFRGVLAALPSTVKAIPVVYPPHIVLGYDDLRELVRRALPVDRPFVLMGESFSGPLAIDVGHGAPPGLVGVALVASFLRAPVGFPTFWRAIARENLFHVTPPRFMLRAALLGGDASEKLVDEARAAVLSVAPRVLVNRVREVLAVDVREACQTLGVPMLYIGATRDRLLGARAREDVRAARRDAEIVLVEGPHLLLQKRPVECARILAAFVDRCARAARGVDGGDWPVARPPIVIR